MFDFNSFPFKLSGKTVNYIYPKCKFEFEAPIEAVLQFEQEDEWNELPISTPPYTICSKCKFDKVFLLIISQLVDTIINTKNNFYNFNLFKAIFPSCLFVVF